jgi:ligand-binding sensor domain-containing protein
MKTVMTHRPLVAALFGIGLLATAYTPACEITTGAPDGGPAVDGGGTTSDAGDSGPCSATGTGRLNVQVTGLPEGTRANVKVRKPNGDETAVESSTSLSDTRAGGYSATAAEIVVDDPVVKTVYRAPAPAAVCVTADGSATLTIAYAAIPTSNKLWMTTSNGKLGELIAFPSSSVRATGAPLPATQVNSQAGHMFARQIAFDFDGNLWAARGGAFARFSAASLAASGSPAPELDKNVNFGCGPALNDLATDNQGGLWVASSCSEGYVVHFTKAQLEGTAPLTVANPAIKVSDPTGLAFDAAGNLWVAFDSKLGRFDAGTLAGTTTTTITMPNLVVDLQTSNPASIPVAHIAFDKDGHLWSAGISGTSIVKTPAAALTGTGTRTVTIDASNNLGVTALIESLAFDASGALWTAGSQGKVVRYTAAQLAASAGTPETILTPADLGYAEDLAFFPGPAPVANAR